jgi:NAD(P)-dependent dehydrogenase (short-subunit alcohol dehydrogenase family)
MALAGKTVTVLAATGSVGRRVARLLVREGASVRVASRQLSRAQRVCDDLHKASPGANVEAWETRDDDALKAALAGATVAISAGAPGVELLPDIFRRESDALQLAIDLNAVPPLGIGGIEPQDKAAERDGQIGYGAIGVGGTKMKLHKAAIQRLFESNDLVLDAEEIYELGSEI